MPVVTCAGQGSRLYRPPPAEQASWFRNYPIMNISVQQGSITSGLLDTDERDFCGEKDLIVFQWFYPTDSRLALRSTGLSYIRSNYPHCKLVMYTILNETFKTVASPQNDAREFAKALIEGANGNANWYARRVNGDVTEPTFDPVTLQQCNIATGVAGLNNLGERYDQAFYRVVDTNFNGGTPANFLDTYVDGLFVDVLNARPPSFQINNGGSTVTDLDFDDDGIAEDLDTYSAASDAGGRMWAQGGLNIKATIETRFPGFLCVPNAAAWDHNYFSGTAPPLPLSSHPYYGRWEIILRESMNLVLGISRGASTYSFTGGGSASSAFRRLSIAEKFLRPDNESVAGRCAVIVHMTTLDRTPTEDDFILGRLFLAVALMMLRCAPSVTVTTAKPLPLDELFLELGDPVGTRSMGTLNETTLAWTMRNPDQESGVADFYWQRFEKAIVVARLDSPSVATFPTSDAAVSCTLPAAGTGKKWQRINATTYVNPTTGYAMRGQNTTLNSGADSNTVSLKPFHAALIRLVDS